MFSVQVYYSASEQVISGFQASISSDSNDRTELSLTFSSLDLFPPQSFSPIEFFSSFCDKQTVLITNHPSCLSSKCKEDSWHLLDSFCTIYSQKKIYFSQQKRQTHTVTMMSCLHKTTDFPVCLYSEAGLHAVQSRLNVLQLKKMYANRQKQLHRVVSTTASTSV